MYPLNSLVSQAEGTAPEDPPGQLKSADVASSGGGGSVGGGIADLPVFMSNPTMGSSDPGRRERGAEEAGREGGGREGGGKELDVSRARLALLLRREAAEGAGWERAKTAANISSRPAYCESAI